MQRPFTPKVVTASDLLIGDVIYLAADDSWVRELARAEVITDEAHAQLRLLHAAGQQNRVVGPYLAEVAIGENGPEPVHFREQFRRSGPSNLRHGQREHAGAHIEQPRA